MGSEKMYSPIPISPNQSTSRGAHTWPQRRIPEYPTSWHQLRIPRLSKGMRQVLLLCACLKMLEDYTDWLLKRDGEVEKISNGL